MKTPLNLAAPPGLRIIRRRDLIEHGMTIGDQGLNDKVQITLNVGDILLLALILLDRLENDAKMPFAQQDRGTTDKNMQIMLGSFADYLSKRALKASVMQDDTPKGDVN